MEFISRHLQNLHTRQPRGSILKRHQRKISSARLRMDQPIQKTKLCLGKSIGAEQRRNLRMHYKSRQGFEMLPSWIVLAVLPT